MKTSEYIKKSLELHLFFARIMKEHSFFMEAGFTGVNDDYKKIANMFQNEFSKILEKAVEIANGNISREVISSKEIVTENTLRAEKVSEGATGINIPEHITRQSLSLTAGMPNESLLKVVSDLNKQALLKLQNLIQFKTEVLNNVLSCKIFTLNYPLLFTHMIREANMYYQTLQKIESKDLNIDDYILDQEKFWNRQMMEHAEFIRGLLDPTEEKLIKTADKFANDYDMLLSTNESLIELTSKSLNEVNDLIKFKEAGTNGLLDCKIRSIIVPLLADHVLREAYHFRRILNSSNLHRFM